MSLASRARKDELEADFEGGRGMLDLRGGMGPVGGGGMGETERGSPEALERVVVRREELLGVLEEEVWVWEGGW